jgi:hypothetical protein
MSQQTQCFPIVKTSRLMLFGEAIAVVPEDHTKLLHILWQHSAVFLNFKIGDTCICRWSL